MEKVVDKATANNYFSISSAEYISNDITSISFLAAVQKGLNGERGEEGENGGKDKWKRTERKITSPYTNSLSLNGTNLDSPLLY